MSATTGAVVSSMVAIQAAQNERIEKQRCEGVLYSYEPQYASQAQMQDYAYCVQKLYPEPMNHTENMVAKGCVLVLLIAFVVGIIYGYKKSKDVCGDWVDVVLWAFLVPACVGLFMCFLGLLLTSIGFLFS